MTHHTTRFLLPSLLTLLLAGGASAAPDGSNMELDLIQVGDELVAVVMLEHAWNAPMELDITYNVNGVNVKTEPVVVSGPTAYVEVLGPVEGYYGVCASIDGLIRINGDLTRPTQGSTCDLHFPGQAASPLLLSLSSRGGDLSQPSAVTPQPVEQRRSPVSKLRRR